MKKLNKRILLYFWFGLLLSVMFPSGILSVVFGFYNDLTALGVVGIVMTVAGFYGTPLVWMGYGSRRQDRAILYVIERDRIYTVSGIAGQTGYDGRFVRDRIKAMILSRMIVGYFFNDDTLTANEMARSDEETTTQARICVRCGATMIVRGEELFCEYCKNVEPMR